MKGQDKSDTAKCYIKKGDKNILWCEVNLKTSEAVNYLSEKEAEKYKIQIIKKAEDAISRYAVNYTDSTFWNNS